MDNPKIALNLPIARALLVSLLLLPLPASFADDNFILPPLDGIDTPLNQDKSIFVDSYNVTGNTRLSDDVINEILMPYTNRDISFTELSALRDELTMAYVQRGYINSGAVIPDQEMQSNILTIQIIEGKLSAINIENDGRLKESFIRKRIDLGDSDDVVNLNTLERKLQVLKQDRLIENLETNLLPGDQRGESVLTVKVEEAKPYHWQIEANNYSSTSVGEETIKLGFQHHNLSGYGDSIDLGAKKSKHSQSLNLRYDMPISIHSSAYISAQKSDAEPEREGLMDIFQSQSNSDVYSLGFNHSILSSVNSELAVFGSITRVQNDAIVDLKFDDSTLNLTTADASLDLISLGLNWNQRNRSQALSLRSTLSYGKESQLTGTRDGNGQFIPDADPEKDSNFYKWLGQAQYARRLNTLDSQLILRTDIQLANKNLITGFEDFSVGGHNYVRGSSENSLRSERGALVSAEWRIPLYKNIEKNASLQLAPFLDYGHVESSDDNDSESLSSVGLGVLWNNNYSDLSLYYGHLLSDNVDKDNDGENDFAKNNSIHFRAAFNF